MKKGAMKSAICKQCGKSFSFPKSKDTKFCSRACYYESMVKPHIELTCHHCGKCFLRKRDYGDTPYCSLRCFGKHKEKEKQELTCLHCGSKFMSGRSPSREIKYCSGICRLASRARAKGHERYSLTERLVLYNAIRKKRFVPRNKEWSFSDDDVKNWLETRKEFKTAELCYLEDSNWGQSFSFPLVVILNVLSAVGIPIKSSTIARLLSKSESNVRHSLWRLCGMGMVAQIKAPEGNSFFYTLSTLALEKLKERSQCEPVM